MHPSEYATEFVDRYRDCLARNLKFDFPAELEKLIMRVQKEMLPPKRKYTKRIK